MKIVLIGFMGSGKSSVAEQLGQILKWPIIEMDQQVCEKTDCKTMNEVFAKGGELLLRETEIAIAAEYKKTVNCIISAGGGVVLNKIILDYFKQTSCMVFFLNASFQTIFNRLKEETSRPLFKDRLQAEELYYFRLPLYKKYADHIVDVEGKTIEEIVNEIDRMNRG